MTAAPPKQRWPLRFDACHRAWTLALNDATADEHAVHKLCEIAKNTIFLPAARIAKFLYTAGLRVWHICRADRADWNGHVPHVVVFTVSFGSWHAAGCA